MIIVKTANGDRFINEAEREITDDKPSAIMLE